MIIRIRRPRKPVLMECFDCNENWRVGPGMMAAYMRVCPYCHSGNVERMA